MDVEYDGAQARTAGGSQAASKMAGTRMEYANPMVTEPWYSARCIFHHRRSGASRVSYEERIILLRADDLADAMRRAEEEAREYAGSLEDVAYLECLDVYHLFEDSIGDGTEVFSLIRDSELGAEEYVSRFFQTGSERSATAEPEGMA